MIIHSLYIDQSITSIPPIWKPEVSIFFAEYIQFQNQGAQ